MLVARGLLLLMMDADGATRVSDLGKLEEELHKLTQQHRGDLDACAACKHCFSVHDCNSSKRSFKGLMLTGPPSTA